MHYGKINIIFVTFDDKYKRYQRFNVTMVLILIGSSEHTACTRLKESRIFPN